MKFYEELLESYDKLKQRKLKISLTEAPAPLGSDSPALQAEPNVISLLSTVTPGQSVNQGGMVFTRRVNDKGQDALYITGGEDPRGRNTAAPVGYFQGNKFTPKEYADGKQIHSRSMWVRILNRFVNAEADPEQQAQAEYDAQIEGMNVPIELDSPRIRQSLLKSKNSLADMRRRGGLNSVIKIKYDGDLKSIPWYGASERNIAGYIVSETDPKALNNKLRNSVAYTMVDHVDPHTGDVTRTLEHSTSVKLPLAEDCLEQFNYSVDIMSRFSDPDERAKITDSDLHNLAGLISVDRKRGLIIKRSVGDSEFIFLPKKESELWNDLVDNHNILLAEQGKDSFSIKDMEVKTNEANNLNDIRGKGIERLLEVVGLIQNKNVEGAKDSLTTLFKDYGFSLFEAFSAYNNHQSGGAVDGESLNQAFIAENINEIFGLKSPTEEIPGSSSTDKNKVSKQTKEALGRILNTTLSLYKDSVKTRKPKAIIHTGTKVNLGDKSDVKEVYSTPGEAKSALKSSGFSEEVINSLGINSGVAGELFSADECAKFGLDPKDNVTTVGLSMKTYMQESNVNLGESSHRQVLNTMTYDNQLLGTHAERLDIGGRQLTDVKDMANALSKSLESFKYLKDPKYATTVVASVKNFIKNNTDHAGAMSNDTLQALNGTNGKEVFNPADKQITEKIASRLTTQAYRAVMRDKLTTKAGRRFIAMKLAMIGGGSEEVMATMKFLDTGKSVNMLQNKAMYDIGKNLIDGTYKIDFNPKSGSVRIHAKEDKSHTICTLKENNRKGTKLDDNEEEITTYVPSYQVMISPKYFNKNNLNESYIEDNTSLLESIDISKLLSLVTL